MKQTDMILKHLKRRPITPLEALNKYGCMRLGARIFELRQAGHDIDSEIVTVKGRSGSAHVAKYSMRGVA